MIEYLGNPAFWASLGEIMLVNILLSGDNAVMIALAARSLPPQQRKKAIIGGSIAAVVILVVLTVAAAELLELPYLRLAGSVLLFWIALQLLLPEDDEEGESTHGGGGLLAAMRTMLVANLVMSLDNVLGVAAVAQGRVALLIAGLGISIPVIVFGSTLVLKLMTRFPFIITIGAGLLGWVAGDMLVSDPAVAPFVASNLAWTRVQLPWDMDSNLVQLLGAAMVVIVGKALASRSARAAPGEATVAANGERATSGIRRR